LLLGVSAADEISALEFDGRGENLAAGDRAGRVIIFRRIDADDVRVLKCPVQRRQDWHVLFSEFHCAN
jgi:hypothetical protein